MKKILIVDDQFVARLGAAAVLKSHFEDIVIDFAANYNKAEAELKSKKYDLIILTIHTKERVVKKLKQIQNDVLILIFSSCDESLAVEYIREGATGYINKLDSERNFINAVKTVLEHKHYYSKNIALKLADQSSKTDIEEILSEKELQVFKLLLQGYRNMEMAKILNLHIATVNTYRIRIFKKLKVNNIVDLMKYQES